MRPEIPMSPLWPALPPPPAAAGTLDPAWKIPSEARCVALWDRFDMPEHIRAHSAKVALVAVQVAEVGRAKGFDVDVELVRASALLHDLAKIYCIRHGVGVVVGQNDFRVVAAVAGDVLQRLVEAVHHLHRQNQGQEFAAPVAGGGGFGLGVGGEQRQRFIAAFAQHSRRA